MWWKSHHHRDVFLHLDFHEFFLGLKYTELKGLAKFKTLKKSRI